MKKNLKNKLIIALLMILSISIGIVLYKSNNSNKPIPKKAKLVSVIIYKI